MNLFKERVVVGNSTRPCLFDQRDQDEGCLTKGTESVLVFHCELLSVVVQVAMVIVTVVMMIIAANLLIVYQQLSMNNFSTKFDAYSPAIPKLSLFGRRYQ